MIKDIRAESIFTVPPLGQIRAKFYPGAMDCSFFVTISEQEYSPDYGTLKSKMGYLFKREDKIRIAEHKSWGAGPIAFPREAGIAVVIE